MAHSGSDLCSVDVSPGTHLAACGRTDGSIHVCRFSRDAVVESRFSAPLPATPPVVVRTLFGHSGPVYSTSISKDSRFLLSGGMDGCVRLWSLKHTASSLVAYQGHAHPVFHVAFSPHNAHFLTGSYDGAVRIFTTERRQPLRVLSGHLAEITQAAFHPNGAYALSASQDGTLRLWDVGAAGCIRILLGHTAPVRAVAVCPKGELAASAGADQTVRVWHLASGRLMYTMKTAESEACSVTFSPTGRLLACAGQRKVSIWQVAELRADTSPALSLLSPVPLLSGSFMTAQPVLLACGADESDSG